MPCFVVKQLLPAIGLLFLAGCQPVQLSSLEPGQAKELLLASKASDSPYRFAHSRPSQKEFKEAFLSDKLDLVFVLDSSPAMESFYKKKLLGENFPDRFQSYDWRMAWTDMSVDIQAFSEDAEPANSAEAEEEEEDSCGFLGGLVLTTAGVFTGQPIISGIGLERLIECGPSIDFDSEEGEESSAPVFTNGAFLPFEYRGQKAAFEETPMLTAAMDSHNAVFDHSLRWGNEKDSPKPSAAKGPLFSHQGEKGNNRWRAQNSPQPAAPAVYEAPEKRETEPYPFLAMALSMARAGSPSSQGESSSFFRKDSLIVYVPITVKDMKFDIDPNSLKQSFDSFFGSAKRVKIIPIALSPNSSFLCQLNFPKESAPRPSSKLRALAGALGHTALDICSASLADELFDEIAKSLYPRGFLTDHSF